ncbi:hypothetical protein, partial [Prevotella denticola]|uniref:hypothetical protein n=1 Tax=Prevotella denticola TaxID=28129 RepID=UPI003C782CE2
KAYLGFNRGLLARQSGTFSKAVYKRLYIRRIQYGQLMPEAQRPEDMATAAGKCVTYHIDL